MKCNYFPAQSRQMIIVQILVLKPIYFFLSMENVLNYTPNTLSSLCNEHARKPHLIYGKVGFTEVCIIFLISAQNNRLWVLVRTTNEYLHLYLEQESEKYHKSLFNICQIQVCEILQILQRLSSMLNFILSYEDCIKLIH